MVREAFWVSSAENTTRWRSLLFTATACPWDARVDEFIPLVASVVKWAGWDDRTEADIDRSWFASSASAGGKE
jgi:hypothetical protein